MKLQYIRLSNDFLFRVYIIPPACLAGFLCGFFLWFLYIILYKLFRTHVLPKLRRPSSNNEGVEAGEADDNAEIGIKTTIQIDPIPRAKLTSSVLNSSKTKTSKEPNGGEKERTSSSSSSSGRGSNGLTDSGRESGSPSPASSELEVSTQTKEKRNSKER